MPFSCLPLTSPGTRRLFAIPSSSLKPADALLLSVGFLLVIPLNGHPLLFGSAHARFVAAATPCARRQQQTLAMASRSSCRAAYARAYAANEQRPLRIHGRLNNGAMAARWFSRNALVY